MSNVLGKRLRYLRVRAGLTGQSLADAIRVHRMEISHWENGRRVPHVRTVIALCRALKCTASELLGV